MEDFNYWSILVAGLAAWGLGAIWYSPIGFGKAWQSAAGMSDADVEGGNMPLIFGTSFVLMCVMMFGMVPALLIKHENITAVHGAFHGACFGVFFAAAAMGINYLYQRKSIKLWLIDGIYQILLLAIGGAVIAAMN
jgi:hypothetical protein